VGLSVWRGGLLTLSGALPLGQLVAFMQYAGLFHQPIQELAERFTGVRPLRFPQSDYRVCSMRSLKYRMVPNWIRVLLKDGIPRNRFDRAAFSYAQGGPC
jgi:hypothetical protein